MVNARNRAGLRRRIERTCASSVARLTTLLLSLSAVASRKWCVKRGDQLSSNGEEFGNPVGTRGPPLGVAEAGNSGISFTGSSTPALALADRVGAFSNWSAVTCSIGFERLRPE